MTDYRQLAEQLREIAQQIETGPQNKHERELTMKPEWMLDIPFDEYNEARAQYLTSHALHDYSRCPAKYRHAQLHAAPRDTAAFAFGRAFHTMMEGPDVFAAQYTVADGPVNDATGEPFGNTTKSYKKWAPSITGMVVSTAEHARLRGMYASVMQHGVVGEIMAAGETFAEATIRADIYGVPCQCRPDLLVFESGGQTIVDWKKTRDLSRFKYDVRDYGYAEQMAFYANVIDYAGGNANDYAYIVAVEDEPPYVCGVFSAPLFAVQCDVRRAIERYAKSVKTNVWPTGYESIREVTYNG